MSVHTAKRRKLLTMVTDPPDIKKDLCNYLRIIDSDKSTASVLDDHKQNLDKVLARWSKQVREIESHSDHVYEKLVYVLEHEYSEANMGLEHFRGKDQLRARYLLEACQDQGFCLYFAQFESSVYGEVEGDFDCEWEADCHDYIHEIESELELGTIFQYNGKRIAEKIDLETEDLLENVDFTCFEPDEERFDGYYGEGYTATHSYFRTCAVIVHRIRRYDFLLHAETTHVQEYVEMLLREMQDGSLSVALQDELKRFCALVIDRWTVHKQHSIFEVARVPDKELESIGKATLRLDCPDLLEKLVIGTSSPVPLDLFQELGRGLVERDVSLWHYGIEMAIWSIRTVSERVKSVDLLMSSYREAGGNAATTMQRMQDFERRCAMNVAETSGVRFSVTAANAQALMRLSEKYGDEFTFQVVLPIVKDHTSNAGFIVAFLTTLFRAGETDTLRPEVVQNLFKDILADVIPALDLHCPASQDFRPEDDSLRVMSAENLANLFFQCEKLDFSHEIDQLADKIIYEASRVNSTTFERILLPLLKQLAPVVERGPNNINTPSYVKIFRTVIPSYINTYVQSPPQKPADLERQPRDCSLYCEDCVGLNVFLKNPDQSSTYFLDMKATRRNHLEERLRGSSCGTKTKKLGTSYMLVVEKKRWEWDNAMRKWNQRCGVALEKVEEIGVERLTGLLGEGWEVNCLPIFADSDLSNDHESLVGFSRKRIDS